MGKIERKIKTNSTIEDVKKYASYLPRTIIYKNGWTINDIETLLSNVERCNNYDIQNEKEQTVLSYRCGKPLICTTCANSKRNQTYNKIREQFNILVQLAKKKKIYLYEMCFTQLDSNKIDYEKFKESFKKFQDQRDGEYRKFIGYVSSVEIKTTYSITWKIEKFHTHAHAIVATSEPLDYVEYDQDIKKELEKKYGRGNIPKYELDQIRSRSKLAGDWFEASGGAENIDCRKLPIRDWDAMQNRLYEIIKYVHKITDDTPEAIIYILVESANKKKVTINGVFREDNEKLKLLLEKNEKQKKIYESKLKIKNTKQMRKNYGILTRKIYNPEYKEYQAMELSRNNNYQLLYMESSFYKLKQAEINTNTGIKKQHNKLLFEQYVFCEISAEQYIYLKNENDKHYKQLSATICRKYFLAFMVEVKKHGTKKVIEEQLHKNFIYPIEKLKDHEQEIEDEHTAF